MDLRVELDLVVGNHHTRKKEETYIREGWYHNYSCYDVVFLRKPLGKIMFC